MNTSKRTLNKGECVSKRKDKRVQNKIAYSSKFTTEEIIERAIKRTYWNSKDKTRK